MSRKYLSALIAVLALTALGVSASSAAAANEYLWEESARVNIAPVGTNFVAENSGKATLTAGGATVTCNEVDVGGTITKNSKAKLETPVAEVQSVVFGGCGEQTAPKGRVVVRTTTTPAWKLKWSAQVGKFVLEGISAVIELKGAGITCSIANKAGSEFKLSWANDPFGFELAELEASAQLLTLGSIVGTCPTEGKETVTLKFESEGIGDATGKLWLGE
jgi:hypothetical protein